MKKTKKKLKIKISGVIYLALFLVCLSLFIYSLFKIIEWKKNNDDNRKINEVLHEYIKVEGNEKFNIDFNKLKESNKDAVAYIKVNNTNIDYVVVKGKDNEYYLSHNFDNKYNKSGWIFADYQNKLDGTDKNLVIYGHNTVDKSMFGSLKDVLNKDWYTNEENRNVILVTENGLEKYEVFSIYKIDNEEYYIKTNFLSDKEFNEFLKTIKSRSIYKYDTTLDENDHILTLSTCANNGKKRVVLHAKKITNEE